MILYNIIKITSRLLKLNFTTYVLSKSYVVLKYSMKLVSHRALSFCDRNGKYRHDNLQVASHIVRLISDYI